MGYYSLHNHFVCMCMSVAEKIQGTKYMKLKLSNLNTFFEMKIAWLSIEKQNETSITDAI